MKFSIPEKDKTNLELMVLRIKSGLESLPQEGIDDIVSFMKERKLLRTSTPLSTGIPPLDHYTYGGIRNKEFWCIMADSGGGKSTMLRFMGIQALLQGKKVLHFQAEDSREACFDLYKSTLLGVSSSKFMFNSFDAKKNKEIDNKLAEFKKNLISDLYVHAFEEFGS